jgi:hypothetical protein
MLQPTGCRPWLNEAENWISAELCGIEPGNPYRVNLATEKQRK